MNQKSPPKSLPWSTIKYCIHSAAGELCPVKMIPRCEACLYAVCPSSYFLPRVAILTLSSEHSLPTYAHQDPTSSIRQIGSSSKRHRRHSSSTHAANAKCYGSCLEYATRCRPWYCSCEIYFSQFQKQWKSAGLLMKHRRLERKWVQELNAMGLSLIHISEPTRPY